MTDTQPHPDPADAARKALDAATGTAHDAQQASVAAAVRFAATVVRNVFPDAKRIELDDSDQGDWLIALSIDGDCEATYHKDVDDDLSWAASCIYDAHRDAAADVGLCAVTRRPEDQGRSLSRLPGADLYIDIEKALALTPPAPAWTPINDYPGDQRLDPLPGLPGHFAEVGTTADGQWSWTVAAITDDGTEDLTEGYVGTEDAAKAAALAWAPPVKADTQPEEDVRGCSCGMADYGAPGHDHDAEDEAFEAARRVPRTCVLTGDADPDDCTTHAHEDDAECVDCGAPCRSLCICVDTPTAEDADLDPADNDVATRFLLVELPLDASGADPEGEHDRLQSDVAAFLHDDPALVGTVRVSQVFPGHVVEPSATVEHDTLRAMLVAADNVANDPGSTDGDVIATWLAVLEAALTRWPGVADADE